MSTHLQSIVFAGMSPAGLPHSASYWIDPSCRDSATAENRVLRIDIPERTDCPAVADEAGDPVDLSAFTASEESLLRRCLKRSLPPAYVDAVIRIVSRSREEMVGELEQCLHQNTRQLHQAVGMIQYLIREKEQLESEAEHLERTRSNLRRVYGALRDVQYEMVEARHKALTR